MKDRGLWIGAALGAPLLLIGITDALATAERTHPAELARWMVGCALALDLLLVPSGLVVGRYVRSVAVRWALATAATIVLVGWPFVRGYGRRSDNPSLLPRNYGLGELVAIAGVAAVAVAWVVVARRRLFRSS